MKHAAWGAVAAVAALVAAFWVGRLTVPDRSAELLAWRDSAAAIGRETAAATAAWAAAQAHAVHLEARADSAERRARAALAVVGDRTQTILALRDSMASLATAADTIGVQAAIIARQDTLIRDLRAGLAEAAEAVRGFREDARAAREHLTAAHADNARLRATIAAGLEVTRPSRGPGSGLRTAAVALLAGALVWEVAR